MNHQVIKLIRSIGFPDIKNHCEPVENEELYQLAFKNKVALLYLDALTRNGSLKFLNEYYLKNILRYNTLFDDIKQLTPALDVSGLKYALIKTFRYYPENPNDIDILILEDYTDKLKKLDTELSKIGYLKYTRGNNKYNFGKVGKIGYWDYKRDKYNLKAGDQYIFFDLDFYLEIMVEEFIHGNKYNFSEYVTLKRFYNNYSDKYIEAKVLTPGAELFYLFFHSIFPTRTIGLELFFSSLYLLKDFSQDDFNAFYKLSYKFHLKNEVMICMAHLQNLYRQAFDENNEKLQFLIASLGRKYKRIMANDINYPYIFPLFIFIWAGIKSAFHKKGIISLIFVLLKCVNPFYAYNIISEILSKKLTFNRYKSKFTQI